MRHRGDLEFPGWCGRIAAAFVLHVGVGWALGGAESLDTPVSERADTRLFWLEPAMESPEIGGPEIDGIATARPAAASSLAARPANAGGALEGGAAAPGDTAAAPGNSRGLAAPRRAPRDAAPAREASTASPLPAQPSAAQPSTAQRSLLAGHEAPAPIAAAVASANDLAARSSLAATGGRRTSSGVRAAGSSAGGLASLASGSSPSGAAFSDIGRGTVGAGGASPNARSPAHLLGASNRCADLFPYAALSDTGTVAVTLEVAASGQPLGSRIVEEAPPGQGFGVAASHCVRRLRFSPALDDSGHVVASRSVVRLRFQRRGGSYRVAL